MDEGIGGLPFGFRLEEWISFGASFAYCFVEFFPNIPNSIIKP